MEDNGLGLFLTALPASLAIDFAGRAESAGFRNVWFPEITFADSFGPATAAALHTSRVGIGTGVVGVWSRSAVTMALQGATLHQLSGGRLLLGLGVQARGYVEGWHGQRYERPIRAMREYVTILRRALAGEAVTFEGEVFSVRNFQLMVPPPERPVRIYVAAIGPQMLRLAGELADGVIGYFWSAAYVREVVVPRLREGVERGGRSLADIDVACGFPTIVGDAGLAEIKGQVLMFATAMSSSPHYADSFAAAGYGGTVREIQERGAAGDVPGALACVTDEVADALTLAGPGEHVRARIGEYRAAGLDTVALNPSPPNVFFPLYEGHFPEGTSFPEFSFPDYLAVIERTLAMEGGSNA